MIFRKCGFVLVFALLFVLPVTADWDLKGYEWVVVLDENSTKMVVGDYEPHRRVDRLRESYDEPFVWVRRGRSEWVITDSTTIDRLCEIMETPDDLDEVRAKMESESRVIEESVRELERRVTRMEHELDTDSLVAALEIAEAAKELKAEELEAAAERMQEGARHLERWVEEFRERVENEALPLIEDAIGSGKARRLR